jgi:hypothetical protein
MYQINSAYMYALSINVQENIICDPTKITDLHKKDQISSFCLDCLMILLEEIQILLPFVHQSH